MDHTHQASRSLTAVYVAEKNRSRTDQRSFIKDKISLFIIQNYHPALQFILSLWSFTICRCVSVSLVLFPARTGSSCSSLTQVSSELGNILGNWAAKEPEASLRSWWRASRALRRLFWRRSDNLRWTQALLRVACICHRQLFLRDLAHQLSQGDMLIVIKLFSDSF